MEILRWVAAGEANSSIARELFVTEQTVKFHLSNIYRKLGVSNRTQASHFAYHNGLLEAPTGAGTASHLAVAA
jgi:DNA-binding NarL/FixJ family response regulator